VRLINAKKERIEIRGWRNNFLDILVASCGASAEPTVASEMIVRPSSPPRRLMASVRAAARTWSMSSESGSAM
jgi:hypothetical protein